MLKIIKNTVKSIKNKKEKKKLQKQVAETQERMRLQREMVKLKPIPQPPQLFNITVDLKGEVYEYKKATFKLTKDLVVISLGKEEIFSKYDIVCTKKI